MRFSKIIDNIEMKRISSKRKLFTTNKRILSQNLLSKFFLVILVLMVTDFYLN